MHRNLYEWTLWYWIKIRNPILKPVDAYYQQQGKDVGDHFQKQTAGFSMKQYWRLYIPTFVAKLIQSSWEISSLCYQQLYYLESEGRHKRISHSCQDGHQKESWCRATSKNSEEKWPCNRILITIFFGV